MGRPGSVSGANVSARDAHAPHPPLRRHPAEPTSAGHRPTRHLGVEDVAEPDDESRQTLLFPDFAFVDFALGGVNRRNNPVLVHQVRPNGTADSYTTIHRFPDSFRHHVERTGSVARYPGPSWSDHLAFDIDRRNADKQPDPEAARRAAVSLAHLLIDHYGVGAEQLQIFFSGEKGFHVMLPTRLLGNLTPSKDLPTLLRDTAMALADEAGITIDRAIYDRTRLLRLPNTEHSRSGLFKVEICWDELKNYDAGAIRDIAASPRELRQAPGQLEPIGRLETLIERVSERRPPGPSPAPKQTPRRSRPNGASVIATWNERVPVGEVLERNGYQRDPHACPPRWLAPGSSTGKPGVVQIEDGRVYSHHSECSLQGQHSHDSFGVLAVLEHGGNPNEAARSARRELEFGRTPTPPRSRIKPERTEAESDTEPESAVRAKRPTPEQTRVGAPTLTDSGNASRLVSRHGRHLHYIPPWGKWLAWDESEGRWHLDHKDVRIRELAKEVGRELKLSAAREGDAQIAKRLFSFAIKSLNVRGISGMVNLARGIAGIPLDHERLDGDGWLLGVENGTIELRSGTFREARPEDLITLQCPVAWDGNATAPRWEQALEEWFPDPEVRSYVQRVAGAALVGVQRDHAFIIHYGSGGNGKGTFVRAIQKVLGPYALDVHLSLLVQTKHAEHDTVKADLFRTRLAVAAETEKRIRLAEASVKNLSGGDRIRARRMREDPWSFDPSHSLWLQTNYLPEISGRDRGIWRRIRVVKWESTFKGRREDKSLDATLADERPGILRWLVRGCLEWQDRELDEPEAVVQETLKYRQSEDIFSRFQADTALAFHPELEIQGQELQDLLGKWAQGEGIRSPTQDVGDWLRENGAVKKQKRIKGPDGKTRRPKFWIGVGLNDADHKSEQTIVKT